MLKVNFTPSHTHRVILSHFFTLMMLDIRRYVTLPDAPSVHLSYYSGKKRWIYSCMHLKSTYSGFLFAKTQKNTCPREWRWSGGGGVKSLNLNPPTPDQLFSPQHSVTLQFRHQPHISRTDVIYQGTSLQQSTHLCTLLDSPLSEPQLWGWYSQPVKFRGYAITEVQWGKKKAL